MKSVYVGESHRTYFDRQQEHQHALATGNKLYGTVKHHQEFHPGQEMAFSFRFHKQHQTSLTRQIQEALTMEELEVDHLMNSRGEWGYNFVPRAFGNTDEAPPQRLATHAGNNCSGEQQQPGNRDKDQDGQNGNKSGNKRQMDEDNDFEQQFAQRRVRRRLAKRQQNEQQEAESEVRVSNRDSNLSTGGDPRQHKAEGNHGLVASPHRKGLATALKWKRIHEDKKKVGNRARCEVSRSGNKKNLVPVNEAQGRQTLILTWFQPNLPSNSVLNPMIMIRN